MTGSHPEHRLFGQVTSRTRHQRYDHHDPEDQGSSRTRPTNPMKQTLDTKRHREVIRGFTQTVIGQGWGLEVCPDRRSRCEVVLRAAVSGSVASANPAWVAAAPTPGLDLGPLRRTGQAAR